MKRRYDFDLTETNTLFLEDLPSYITERDILNIFKHYSGFVNINFVKQHYKTMCFISFTTIENARKAINIFKKSNEIPNSFITFAKTSTRNISTPFIH